MYTKGNGRSLSLVGQVKYPALTPLLQLKYLALGTSTERLTILQATTAFFVCLLVYIHLAKYPEAEIDPL